MHGLDGIPYQIQQHLLDLNLLDKDQAGAGIEAEHGLDPGFIGANERQRARLLDQLVDVLGPLLGLTAGDEFAELPDNRAGAQGLLGRLRQSILDL